MYNDSLITSVVWTTDPRLNVRAPYSVETFGNIIFFAIVYLSRRLTSVQNFTEIVPGEVDLSKDIACVTLEHLIWCVPW